MGYWLDADIIGEALDWLGGVVLRCISSLSKLCHEFICATQRIKIRKSLEGEFEGVPIEESDITRALADNDADAKAATAAMRSSIIKALAEQARQLRLRQLQAILT